MKISWFQQEHLKKAKPFDLDRRDFDFIEKISPFLDGLYRHYFRCEFEGWENAPKQKALFVGNHNGLITFEVIMLFYAWWKHFGPNKKALGLAHGIATDNPLFSWICPKIGAMPAQPDLALRALDHGYSLMVYPGGEKEAFRPYKERRKVDFFGRKGFIRLALKAQVPLVPIISCGGQETYVILDRGEKLAEKLGLKEKYRLHGVPITYRSLFFMWCLASGAFTLLPLFLAPAAFASIFVPLPAKMNFKMLPQIPVSDWVDRQRTDEENLQYIYDRVLEIMQDGLHSAYAKRRYPLVG